jgi:hypothetical protein
MALNRDSLFTLARQVANANPSAPVAYSFEDKSYSYADLDNTLRSELNDLIGTYALWRENHNVVFALMEEIITDKLPAKVMQQYGAFAEVKTYRQGEKPIFTQKITEASRRRAKQFIAMPAGLAGRYEVFKLDGRSYEVKTSAMAAACQIAIEEYLDGRVDMATLIDIVMEGMDDRIYAEIASCLIAAVDNIQAANKVVLDSFVEAEMDALLAVADSYGNGRSTIYCTFEFASQMLPDNAWEQGKMSDAMKDEYWSNGRLAGYKGHQVIVLRQSYTDETNSTKAIDPAYAWIIPGGADKPIKIAFEGDTMIREEDNDDWSKSIHFYKKVGVAAMINNDICVYKNTSLTIDR